MYMFSNFSKDNYVITVMGLIAAICVPANTVYVIWHVVHALTSGVSLDGPVFPPAVYVAMWGFSVTVYSIPIFVIRSKTSLRGEILGDWIAMKTLFSKAPAQADTLRAVISFVLMYHLVMPVVIYTLVRYRKALGFALDPYQFIIAYHKHLCPGNIELKLLSQHYASGHITDSDLADFFIKLGNRYFVENNAASLYLKLSYSQDKLLCAFGLHRQQMLGIMIDLAHHDQNLDDLTIQNVIDTSFTIA